MSRLQIAALAMLAWFLIAPPTDPNTNTVLPDAPISDWIAVGKFKTSEDCENIRANQEPERFSPKIRRFAIYVRRIEDSDSRQLGPGLTKESEPAPQN
jgi:hypothetical protein